MKIVATSDTHFQFDVTKIPEGDVFIHAGDLMYTGFPDEWSKVVEPFGFLAHPRKYYIPGNHDFHPQIYPGPCYYEMHKRKTRILGNHSEHFTDTLPNGMTILGLPFVTGLEGWAYNRTEAELRKFVMTLPRADIVVTHSPPKGILDFNRGWGCDAWNFYLKRWENAPPRVWICGHIHESYGHQRVGFTDFYNVAMCDKDYQQVNPPMVIEV